MLFFLILAMLSFLVLFLRKGKKNEPFCPPPGPKGLPFIGNIHQHDFNAPHACLAKLGKTYGPILYLRFGYRPVVVVQSAQLAKEVLKTQDQNFCNRPAMVGLQRLSYNGLDIAFSPYNEYFREIKKISVVYLLNSKRVQSFSPIRQEELSRLMEKISSSHSSTDGVVNLSELLPNFTFSNICRIAFGKRYEESIGPGKIFQHLLGEMEALFISFFFSDYFPHSDWLDKLTGRSSRLKKACHELDAFYQTVINDHLDPNRPKSNHEDIIDVLLQLQKERPFSFELTMDHVKAVLMNIFVAGTDTSSSMVIWAMMELVKNTGTMKKVQEELRNNIDVTRNDGYIVEDDLSHLKYFKAVIKETFRLHPAAPLLIVHENMRKTKIQGYDIPPKTSIYVNTWAIGRDPESWKDPEMFLPERFIASSIDFKGHDFELIPFGAGRRMCPGLHLGASNMEVTLANLLRSFDWELPLGVNKEDIDTDSHPGITMVKKNPLCLVANKFM